MKKHLLIAGAIAFAGSLSAQIFSEDFEGGTMPAGWAVTTMATDGGWNIGTEATIGSAYFPFSGNATNFAGTNDDDCNCDKSADFLTSADIDLTNETGAVFMSYKQYFFALSYSGSQEVGTIKVSTDGGTSYSVLSAMAPVAEWATAIYDLTAYAGQTIKVGFEYNDGGGWTYGMGIDDVSVYVPANEDVTLTSIDLPNYAKVNTAVDVKGTITNNAGVAITTMDIEYTIDGGTPVVANLTGLNIAPLATYDFTHTSSWTPTAVASYNVEVEVTAVNGAADADITDNVLDQDIIIYNDSYPRVVLYETFTSSTCAPCVAGNANFESVKAGIPAAELASVKYQMSWPGAGDPYNNADGNLRRVFYSINSVPAMEIDGGWDGNSSSFTMQEHTDALEVPAFVKVSAEYEVDAANQMVKTCTRITAMQDMPNAVLHVAIKENKTTANTGSNGETEFLDVVKKMAPDGDGTMITITAGMSERVCLDYTFNGSYRLPNDASDLINDATEHSVEEFTDLAVVAWVQAVSSKAVYNSSNATVGISPVSVNDVLTNVSSVSVYPNPAVNTTTVSINTIEATEVSITVLDVVGKTAMVMNQVNLNNGANSINLNTTNLKAGVYTVVVTSNDDVATKQLVIQK